MKVINEELSKKSGIYMIINIENGNKYIGSSKSIKERLQNHIWHLNKGTHNNGHLQNAWNKYGYQKFDYGILCICDEKDRFEKEQYFINIFNPEYNIDIDVKRNFLTQETKNKISKSIKELYNNGFVNSNKIKEDVYLYDIDSLEMINTFNCIADAAEYVYKRRGSIKYQQVNNAILKNKYVLLNKNNFKSKIELKNFINKNIMHYKTFEGDIRYLIVEKDDLLIYCSTLKDAMKYIETYSLYTVKRKISKSNKENPLLIPKSNIKIYITNEYIEIEDKAVL